MGEEQVSMLIEEVVSMSVEEPVVVVVEVELGQQEVHVNPSFRYRGKKLTTIWMWPHLYYPLLSLSVLQLHCQRVVLR